MASRDPSTTPAEDRNGASGKKDRQQIEMNNMASPQPQMPIEEDLMGLARLGELRAIQKLFDSGKYNANSADEQGITALHVSTFHTPFKGRRVADTGDLVGCYQRTLRSMPFPHPSRRKRERERR